SGKQISDETFVTIKKLEHITELNLSKTNVTDAEMERLNEPERGRFFLKLNLSSTAVTNAGLEKLSDLNLLMELNLIGTKVTPAAVERFKKDRAKNPNLMPLFKSPTIKL